LTSLCCGCKISRFTLRNRDEKPDMVSGQDASKDPLADAESITAVANKALLFGEFSAKAAGPDTFEDPVMHTYFLHYVFGAVEGLATHASLPAPLGEDGRVNAMGHALMTFEGATREDVMATLKMIYRARDEAALRVREEGRKAAEAWDWGENRAAVSRFAEMLGERETYFPVEVEPSPPLATPSEPH
jgi:hypothetical protein